jgi:carbon starvation protein
MALDDTRVTPAHTLNDGQNFHPTHRWVLFGHHFAAITGAGPLIGPVLASQFGLRARVDLARRRRVSGRLRARHHHPVASTRRRGASLAEIARMEIGPVAGFTAAVAISSSSSSRWRAWALRWSMR